MRHAVATVVVLALASCGSHETRTAPKLSPARIIDCVSSWSAPQRWLKFWGDHPDYRPDDGTIGIDDELTNFNYRVVGDRIRLWIDHGKTVAEVKFKLKELEDSRYTTTYQLTFAEPVFGRKSYEGVLSGSYQCDPEGRD